MNIIYDLNQLEEPLKNPVLTIGNFDGVHKGHVALFEKVKKRAEAIHGQSAVMTFEPHPIRIIKPGNGPPLITPTEQKLHLISNTGVDVIFCLPFNDTFASMSATDFVKDILVREIGIREVVVGYDYTFGNQRQGNITLLQKMGQNCDFRVHVVGPVHIDSQLVSSTIIRNLVQEGKLSEAKKLLGRNYQICGKVIKGENRGGRILGFPTANLKLVDELIPRRGVYAVKVDLDNRIYWGVTNIGYNPTFGDNALSVETHLIDFSSDVLGKVIKLNFVQRLREEITFKSIDELSAQIAEDVEKAKTILGLCEEN